MTVCFGVNANNDLFIGPDGNLVIVNALEATLEACEHAVKAQLGEMVLAIDQGIPTLQTLWVGTPNFAQFEAALRRAILAVSGVSGVVSLNVSQLGDQFFYIAIILTVYGTGEITGELISG
jgi:hypothetical protein